MIRKLLFASAALVIATPAAARDGSPYVGLEGGLLFPQHMSGIFTSTFTQTAQTPAPGAPSNPLVAGNVVGTLPATFTTLPAVATGGANVRLKNGYDIDAILGYDFGMFRLEGELGYKHSSVKSFSQDTAFGTTVTTGLTPAGATQTTAFVFPNGNLTAFNLTNNLNIWSGMINGLVDFGDASGVSFYVGAGIGRARVKLFQNSDSAWAYQGIAGVRFAVSPNIDIGLKYRYFRTGDLDFAPTATTFSTVNTVAVPNVLTGTTTPGVGTTNVSFTRTANVVGSFGDHFSSHSLLLSLA